MKKINALIDKLQELKNDGAGLSEIAYYTQLLYAELMCAKKAPDQEGQNHAVRKKVAVIMPGYTASVLEMENSASIIEQPAVQPTVVRQEKTMELQEKDTHYSVNGNMVHAADVKKKTLFDPVEEKKNGYSSDIEALTPKEINEVIAEHKLSLNDKLKRENIELATRLTESVPVKDLSRAIDVNNKFLFINELFRGDRDMFDRSVKTINECIGLQEAEYWMGRELKIKLGWQDQNNTVQQFYQLVRKRFS